MNKKYFWIIGIVILLIISISLWFMYSTNGICLGCGRNFTDETCTQEAKICPDGSTVGRVPPNCDFAPCPSEINCSLFSADNCPSLCVVCPPCETCNSISCQTEEFCKSIGFDRNWWESVRPKSICKCPEGYVQEGDICNPGCYYSTPKCLAPSIMCIATNNQTTDELCTASGGTVTTRLCCQSSGDFPNTCLIGACGCSPDNSHDVKVCDCGEGKCWDNAKNECVTS